MLGRAATDRRHPRAVNGLMAQVLEGHVREHLGAENATPQQRQEDIEVVLTVLRSYLK